MNLFCLLLAPLTVSMASALDKPAVEWTHDLKAPASAPTLFPDEAKPTGVVVASGRDVIRLDGKGAVVWQTTLDEATATAATVADLDGDGQSEVVVALTDGTLVCLDSAGQRRWVHPFHTPAGGFKNIAAADVLPEPGLELLFGFDDGWLNCVSAKGELLWRFFGDRFRVSPVAVADADGDGAPEVVYGTDNGHVYSVSAWGQIKWRYSDNAPYGRSGPNIADLDSDGHAEVLIARSNVGLDRGLIALDGATGKFRWRTNDMMQSYVGNAVVKFDDGPAFVVLHGDKGNWFYCTAADGKEQWRVELGGRGIFWAPAVADFDGDGSLDALVPMRGKSPVNGACLFVVTQSGAVAAALDLGGGTNATPAVGDMDGDGKLEAVVVTQGPDKVQSLTWDGTGRVAWPSLRGDSRMSGATNLSLAASRPYDAPLATGQMTIQTGPVVWGENVWKIVWPAPSPEGALIELSAAPKQGPRQSWITELEASAKQADVRWRLTSGDETTVTLRLFAPGETAPAVVAARSIKSNGPDFCRFDEVARACRSAMQTGKAAHADASGIELRLQGIEAAKDALASGVQLDPDAIADAATALRKQADALQAAAEMLDKSWRGGGSGSFIFWQDDNPWETFCPSAVPAEMAMDKAVVVSAYGDEFEDVALTLLNVTSEPLDVRCTFSAPGEDQEWTKPEPELAKHITLRRALPIAATLSERVFDVLPELDPSRTIQLPPGEARQLWLVVNTEGLPPGRHDLVLHLRSLTKPITSRAAPLHIEVWPVRLPKDVFVKMNWSNMNPGEFSDQAVRDMIDHGISSIYGPPTPAVPVDATGQLAGKVDWTAFDEALQRIPPHFFLLWGSPPTRTWPQGLNPSEESPEYFTGFKTAVAQLAEHLLAKGRDYAQWAFYPIDEPWNTGFTEIPHLKKFCEMVKRADPKAQNYADPAGLVRAEYLDEFKDLIDVWQPEINSLKRDPRLVEWFRRNARHYWTYEAPGPAKDLPPLAHYRAFSWLAWKLGCEGAGYWVYRSNDAWRPGPGGDYSAIYPLGADVVPSRRWEADRDGVEDYRALYLLRKESDHARAAGRTADADRAQALLDEAVEAVVGWQFRNIDEITRMTRDSEMDFGLLAQYRSRIKDEIVRLRGE